MTIGKAGLLLQEGGDMDPRDHKGEEGATEAVEDGMTGEQSCADITVNHFLSQSCSTEAPTVSCGICSLLDS